MEAKKRFSRLIRENTVKIVATLGPASESKKILSELIKTGVDIFRLNFSHGTHDEKRDLVKRIREVDDYVGIMCDIQGPKIRVGNFKDDKAFNLHIGDEVRVFEKEIIGDQEQFSIPLVGFLDSISKGDFFFVNDGLIKIQVKKKERDHIIGEVMAGGIISNRKGVNIPRGELSQRVPTEKDIKDLELIAEINPEYLAISFVSSGADVLHVKKILENYGNNSIKFISKFL